MTFSILTLNINGLKCNTQHNVMPGVALFYSYAEFHYADSGSAISNGREPRGCFGQVFNFKLDSFA
jgi:hypothetical protein